VQASSSLSIGRTCAWPRRLPVTEMHFRHFSREFLKEKIVISRNPNNLNFDLLREWTGTIRAHAWVRVICRSVWHDLFVWGFAYLHVDTTRSYPLMPEFFMSTNVYEWVVSQYKWANPHTNKSCHTDLEISDNSWANRNAQSWRINSIRSHE